MFPLGIRLAVVASGMLFGAFMELTACIVAVYGK